MRKTSLGKVLVALCVVGMVCVTGCHKGSTSAPAGGSGASSTSQPSGGKPGAGGPLFDGNQPFTNNISGVKVSARSAAIIEALNGMGGWGNDNNFQIDFSIPLFFADRNTPRVPVVADDNYCDGGPDCDKVPAKMPVPSNAHFEGSPNMSCDVTGNTDGQSDCHLLVAERDEHKLYEVYLGSKNGDSITTHAFFVWDLKKKYPETLRGDQCTSADAAGFPIAALLPTADEVAAGAVNHPLRFILPNPRMKAKVYVRPATHAGGPDSEDPNAPPYGVRFRLKADFDESPFSASEKVIIKALKTYGMLLSDGGQIPLTFADDSNSTAKWANLGITDQSFSKVGVENFEVVELGNEIPLTYDCVRNP